MTERRSLIDLINPPGGADPAAEEQFVYQGRTPEAPPVAPVPAAVSYRPGRSPVSTRIRSDLADALKRASLERQLKGITPYTVQDILEAVLEPRLKRNGYHPSNTPPTAD